MAPKEFYKHMVHANTNRLRDVWGVSNYKQLLSTQAISNNVQHINCTQSGPTVAVSSSKQLARYAFQTMQQTNRENKEASPQGGAETYKWNVVPTLTRNKLFPPAADCSKIHSRSPARNADISP